MPNNNVAILSIMSKFDEKSAREAAKRADKVYEEALSDIGNVNFDKKLIENFDKAMNLLKNKFKKVNLSSYTNSLLDSIFSDKDIKEKSKDIELFISKIEMLKKASSGQDINAFNTFSAKQIDALISRTEKLAQKQEEINEKTREYNREATKIAKSNRSISTIDKIYGNQDYSKTLESLKKSLGTEKEFTAEQNQSIENLAKMVNLYQIMEKSEPQKGTAEAIRYSKDLLAVTQKIKEERDKIDSFSQKGASTYITNNGLSSIDKVSDYTVNKSKEDFVKASLSNLKSQEAKLQSELTTYISESVQKNLAKVSKEVDAVVDKAEKRVENLQNKIESLQTKSTKDGSSDSVIGNIISETDIKSLEEIEDRLYAISDLDAEGEATKQQLKEYIQLYKQYEQLIASDSTVKFNPGLKDEYDFIVESDNKLKKYADTLDETITKQKEFNEISSNDDKLNNKPDKLSSIDADKLETDLNEIKETIIEISKKVDNLNSENSFSELSSQVGVLDEKLNNVNGSVDKLVESIQLLSSLSLSDLQKTLIPIYNGINQVYKDNNGNRISGYWNTLKQEVESSNTELKNLLKTIGLFDSKSNSLKLINDGMENSGGIIGDDKVLIARKNRGDRFEEKTELKKRLDEAYEAGINVSRILDIIGTKESNVFFDIQEKASGNILGNIYGQNEEDFVNMDWLYATDEQIKKLVADMIKLQEMGINVESNLTNIMYDKEKGFSFIDMDLGITDFENNAELMQDHMMRIFGDLEDFYIDKNDSVNEKLIKSVRERFEDLSKQVQESYANAQDSNSPSKEFEKLENDAVDGVVVGANENEEKLKNVGKQMAENVKAGFKESISEIGSELNLDKSNISSENSIVESQNKIQEELKETQKQAEETSKAILKVTAYRGTNGGDPVTSNKSGATFWDSKKNVANMYGTNSSDKTLWSSELSFNNPLVIDAKKQKYGDISYLGDGADKASKAILELTKRENQLRESLEKSTKSGLEEVAMAYELQDVCRQIKKISDDTSNPYGTHSSDWFAEYAKNNGYDGLHIKNVLDSPDSYAKNGTEVSDVFVTFQREQLENTVLLAKANKDLAESEREVALAELGVTKNSKENSENSLENKIKEIFTDTNELKKVLDSLHNGSYFSFGYEENDGVISRIRELIDLLKEYGYTVKNFKDDTEAFSVSGAIVENPMKDVFQGEAEKSGMDAIASATEEAVQSKKDFATANEGVQSSIDGSKSPLQLEAELMDQIAKSARESANAKKEFVEANKQVKDSVTDTNEDKKRENTEENTNAWKELTYSIQRYSEVSKRISSGKALEGDVEEASRLENKISQLQKLDILSPTQIEKSEQMLTKLYDSLDDIEKKSKEATLESLNSSIDKYRNDYNSRSSKPAVDNQSDQYKKLLANYETSIKELEAYRDKIRNNPLVSKEDLNQIDELTKKVKESSTAFNSLTASQKGSTPHSRGKAIEWANDLLKQNSKWSKKAKIEVQGWIDKLASADPSNVEEIRNRILEVVRAEREAGNEGKTWLDIFSTKKLHHFLGQAASMFSFYDLINIGREGFQTIRELDTALTEMKKVSDETTSSLKEFQSASFDVAQQVGTTALEIQNSAADFMRLGYSLEDASKFAEDANIYANVGDMDITEATEHMISSIQAWQSEFSSATEASTNIIDRYNEIGNRFAITSADIGSAMERSAAALKAGGNTLNESIGLITAGNLIQQDADTTANALKVMSLRIRGAKADLESMGESTDDLANSTSKLRDQIKSLTGVDIMIDENTFKSTARIIQEIGAEWENLTDVSKASTLELLAGKTRASTVAGLIENYQTIDEVVKAAEESSGSAKKENEKYLESINGKIALLTNNIQKLAFDVIDSGLMKSIIDFGSGTIKILDNVVTGFDKINSSISSFGGTLGAISGLLMNKAGIGECTVFQW